MTDKWSSPADVSRMTPFSRVDSILPTMKEIPKEFHNMNHPWCKWQSKWFFNGLTNKEIPTSKEGIDAMQAMTHLAMIQQSWDPAHEHKMAAVAYLASLWFVEPK